MESFHYEQNLNVHIEQNMRIKVIYFSTQEMALF